MVVHAHLVLRLLLFILPTRASIFMTYAQWDMRHGNREINIGILNSGRSTWKAKAYWIITVSTLMLAGCPIKSLKRRAATNADRVVNQKRFLLFILFILFLNQYYNWFWNESMIIISYQSFCTVRFSWVAPRYPLGNVNLKAPMVRLSWQLPGINL